MSNIIDYFFAGINFEKQTIGKVGEIVYPAYNKTNGWFTKPRWDLITKVDKNNNILNISYIYNYSTVKAIELIQELNKSKITN